MKNLVVLAIYMLLGGCAFIAGDESPALEVLKDEDGRAASPLEGEEAERALARFCAGAEARLWPGELLCELGAEVEMDPVVLGLVIVDFARDDAEAAGQLAAALFELTSTGGEDAVAEGKEYASSPKRPTDQPAQGGEARP